MTYTVTIRSTGVRFTVKARVTILQAGLRQGVTLPYDCHGGMCGVCISRVIEGRITYPDGPPLAAGGRGCQGTQRLVLRRLPGQRSGDRTGQFRAGLGTLGVIPEVMHPVSSINSGSLPVLPARSE
jgi:ferredoxin